MEITVHVSVDRELAFIHATDDNDNWSHWDSATGVRVSVLACLLAGAAGAEQCGDTVKCGVARAECHRATMEKGDDGRRPRRGDGVEQLCL